MRILIRTLLINIADFIFPPKKEEIIIRNISPEDFYNSVKKSGIPEFNFIYSIFAYKDPLVRELIWQIKYRKNKHAIDIAGHVLYDYLYRNNFINCILIPIPISRKRRKERGYNQTELIVDEIMKLDMENRFIKNYKILSREKDLSRQTLKNRKERLEAKDIFKAKDNNFLENNLQNKKIIIIDDVTTTGNTAREARDTMLKVGFIDVLVVTLGH